MKYLTRTIWILSLVSLFTDMASEMLYPIMPLYLQQIGFSIVIIGLLEGVAEAVAGLSKGYFGKLSDATGRRVIFVQAGYAISALSKPLMAFFIHPVWVFFVRTTDRVGKGLRTGARDALLAEAAIPKYRGSVFGFHKALDTLGAVAGPAIALLYLNFYPENYRTLFIIAFVPGLLAIFITLLLKKDTLKTTNTLKSVSFFSFLSYWKQSPAAYRKMVKGFLAFAIINSSDVFLLLQVKAAGVNEAGVISLYIFYNIIYAAAAFPLGLLADKLGFKKLYVFGVLLFVLVYIGMAYATTIPAFMVLFFLYGVYAAATEGIAKAWISTTVSKTTMATALGGFAAYQSICALLASSVAGLIWYALGAKFVFLIAGISAITIALYFTLMKPNLNVSNTLE